MLRIKIELDSAITRETSTLGTAEIWNTGKGGKDVGVYGFRIHGKDGRLLREGAVGGFWRRKYNAWWLLAGVLAAAYTDLQKAFVSGKLLGGTTVNGDEAPK